MNLKWHMNKTHATSRNERKLQSRGSNFHSAVLYVLAQNPEKNLATRDILKKLQSEEIDINLEELNAALVKLVENRLVDFKLVPINFDGASFDRKEYKINRAGLMKLGLIQADQSPEDPSPT